MEIETSGDSSVAVVAVNGRIDAYTAPEVEQRLTEAVDSGRALVVDLTDVDFISSAGLRVLLTLAKRTRSGEFEMRLCGLQPSVWETLDITGFIPLFEIRDTRQEAVDDLSGD